MSNLRLALGRRAMAESDALVLLGLTALREGDIDHAAEQLGVRD